MTGTVRCRYLGPGGFQCENHAVEEDAEIDLCIRHLLAAVELLKAHGVKLSFGAETLQWMQQ